MNFTQFYGEIILSQRQWSWSLIGIGYLASTMFARQLFFRHVIHETKQLDSKIYASVRDLYLKKSLPGWVFFLASFILTIVSWVNRGDLFSVDTKYATALSASLLLFLLSVILHHIAYTRSLLTILRQKMGFEKEY